MLQQILKDMYIEPDLLAELSEEQKQSLFVKMREEQVRRWKEREKEWDEEKNRKPKKPPKPGRRKVEFLLGRDGSEWVWVMGEHKADKSVGEILEQEAQEIALKQAIKEAEELWKKEDKELDKTMEEEKKKLEKEKQEVETELRRKQEEAALYQSIKEARKAAQKLEEERKKKQEEEQKKLHYLKVVQERQRKKSVEKYDNMRHRRSSEIYIRWKEMRLELEKSAEESSKEVEASWQEQEKRAKEAEQKMRDLARKAREEYRASITRTNNLIQAAHAFSKGIKIAADQKPPVPPKKHLMGENKSPSIKRTKNRPPRPPNRAAVIAWFQEEEKVKGAGLDPDTDKIAPWFHGIINRTEAENLLGDKVVGTFLVRVSERVWGYTISYKGEDRIKHFLIDTTDTGYQFFGASQIQHESLAGLVNFQKDSPITLSGDEKLVYPCGQSSDPPDYWDLFHSRQSETTSL